LHLIEADSTKCIDKIANALGQAMFKMPSDPDRFLTPPEIARRLRVSPEKVLGWIRRAELTAINVSNATRPRYRISPESLERFLRSREVPSPPARRRYIRRPPEGGPIDPVLGEKLIKSGKATKVGNRYYRVWNGITLFF